MRRSSIITIILLVLVIIGLTVALIVTNLPDSKKVEESNVTQNNVDEENDSQVTKPEEPKELSLNDDRVKEMYQTLNRGDVDFFHYFKKGSITVKDFTDEDIQTIAYFNRAVDKQEELSDSERFGVIAYKLQTKYMDEAVKEIFGDVEYTHSYARFQDTEPGSQLPKIAEYDKDSDVYYIGTGFGGGGSVLPRTAITKVEEYSDKYVVTEKLLVTDSYSNGYSIYPFYGRETRFSKYLGNITYEEIDNLTNSKNVYSVSEYDKDVASKLISKYYDYCTEYKHTFMKNEDGTYYWCKSEIVK